MVEYATLLSNSIKSLWYGFNQDSRMLLPGILLALAVVLVLVDFLKPPKV